MSDELLPLASHLRRHMNESLAAAGEHLKEAELVAFLAGTTEESAGERHRHHLSVCKECADRLLALAEIREAAAEGEDYGSPQLVAEDWRRLETLLTGQTSHGPVRTSSPRWPGAVGRLGSRWLAAAAIWIVLVGIIAVLATKLSRSANQRDAALAALAAAQRTEEPEIAINDEMLILEGKVLSAATPFARVDLGPSQALFLALSLKAPSLDRTYRLEIADLAGKVVVARSGLQPRDPQGQLTLRLPRSACPPGRYQVRVTPDPQTSATLREEFFFEVAWR